MIDIGIELILSEGLTDDRGVGDDVLPNPRALGFMVARNNDNVFFLIIGNGTEYGLIDNYL